MGDTLWAMSHLRTSALACFVGAATLGAASLPACEESTPPPPAAAGGTGSRGGGPLSGLHEQPTSLLGRSAQSGKTAAAQVEQGQARALAEASEITGEAAAVEVGGVAFSVPAEWRRGAGGPMRAAEYKVGDGPSEGTVVFFFFPGGQGGNVTQNLDRWRTMVLDDAGQPAEQEVIRRTVNGMATTIVSSEGTYNEGMPGQTPTPRRGYAFRGAIIEGPQGNVFVRLTGPASTVQAAEAAWRQMIEGARKK